jgi:hypothetical protein
MTSAMLMTASQTYISQYKNLKRKVFSVMVIYALINIVVKEK